MFNLFAALISPVQAASLPLDRLSNAEKAYYEHVFDYVMETVKPDAKYTWISHSGNQGTLTVTESYISKSGSTCRNFAEIYTVAGREGSGEGVGCKREGEDGWCKLKLNDALTCSMEPNATSVEDTLRDATESVLGTEGKVKGIRQMLP